jgi:hypothetical protein
MWPIARIDPARCFASTARAKTLSVGGTGRSLAEVPSERQFVVVVDDLSARFGIGLVTNVEGVDTNELTGRDSRTSISHPGDTKVDGVGKHGRLAPALCFWAAPHS